MRESGADGQESPETRYAYGGRVRLLVPFDPWRLLLTLRGLNVSARSVSALLMGSGAREDLTLAETAALLVEGDPYDLQIEHESDALPTPFIRARLVSRNRTGAGLELTFAFEAPDGDLLGLIAELAGS